MEVQYCERVFLHLHMCMCKKHFILYSLSLPQSSHGSCKDVASFFSLFKWQRLLLDEWRTLIVCCKNASVLEFVLPHFNPTAELN